MKLKGSLTVEASLIVPITLFVLITMLFISIYMHELTCLQAVAHRVSTSVQELLDQKGKEETQQILKNEIERLAKRDLLLQKGTLNVVCQITEGILSNRLEVRIQKEFITPFKAIDQLMNSSSSSYIKINVYSNTKFISPTRFIRGVDFIDDISSEITITNEMKEKYTDMIEQLETIIDKWV